MFPLYFFVFIDIFTFIYGIINNKVGVFMWYESVQNFIANNAWLKILLETYFVFIIVALLIYLIAHSRRALYLIITIGLIVGIYFLAKFLGLPLTQKIFGGAIIISVLFAVFVLAPDLRNIINYKQDLKESYISSSDNTRNQIADAVMYLSSKKIGALITLERHNSLDQYAERAIQLNADVSKELLINIFIPNTPLHDGAVIIRGNKIRCAGAYYVLTQDSEINKTTGSRHRAALGISENTDSLSIVCSEETGHISVATEGMLLKMNDREKLISYIDLFMDKK